MHFKVKYKSGYTHKEYLLAFEAKLYIFWQRQTGNLSPRQPGFFFKFIFYYSVWFSIFYSYVEFVWVCVRERDGEKERESKLGKKGKEEEEKSCNNTEIPHASKAWIWLFFSQNYEFNGC